MAAIGKYVYVATDSIYRLRSDGTLDDGYRCELGTNSILSSFQAIRPAPDGGLIVAGTGYIAKLDADGKIDRSFVMNQFRSPPPFMGESIGPFTYDCAVDSKGRIVVCGGCLQRSTEANTSHACCPTAR